MCMPPKGKSIVFAARAKGNFPLKPLTRCLLRGGQTNIRGIYVILFSEASAAFHAHPMKKSRLDKTMPHPVYRIVRATRNTHDRRRHFPHDTNRPPLDSDC